MATDEETRKAAIQELARRELERRRRERSPVEEPIPPPLDPMSMSDEQLAQQDPLTRAQVLTQRTAADLTNRFVNYAQDASRYAQRQFVGDGSAGGLIGARVYRGLNPFLSRDTSLEEDPNAQRAALKLEDSVGPTGAALAQFGAEMLPMAAITAGSGYIGRSPVLAELPLSQVSTPFAAIAQAAPKLLPTMLRVGAANTAQNAATVALGSPEGQRLESGSKTLIDPQNLLLSFGPGLLGLAIPGELQYRASRAAERRSSAPSLPRGETPSSVERTPLTQPESLLPLEADVQRAAIQEAGGLRPEPRTARYAEDPAGLPPRELEQYIDANADDIAANFKTMPGAPPVNPAARTEVGVPRFNDSFIPTADDTIAWMLREGRQLFERESPGTTQAGEPRFTVNLKVPKVEDPLPSRIESTGIEGIDRLDMGDKSALPPRTESAGIDIYRFSRENISKDFEKGKAVHFSIGAPLPNYNELGTQLRAGKISAKNPLVLSVSDNGPPLIEALRKLDPALYREPTPRLIEIAEQKTGNNFEEASASDLWALLGAIRARELGFDAIISPGRISGRRKGVRGEYVALAESALVEKTSPGTSADIAKLGIGPGGPATEQVRLAQFARDYRLKTGRDPSPTELANALNITKPHAEKLLKYLGPAQAPELLPEPALPAQGETLKQRLARARSQMLSGTSAAETPTPQAAPRPLPATAPVDHPEIVRQAQVAEQQARALRREGFFEGVRKGFLAPQFRAEAPYAAAGIRSYEAANAIANRQMGRVYPIVRKVMRTLDAQGQNIVRKFVQQSIAPVKGQQVVPLEALPREVQSLFKAGIEQMKGQRNDLVKAGYFTPEQVAKMGEMDTLGIPWLHRDYLAYVDGKYVPKVENFERAMVWLARKNGKTPSDARAVLLDMLSGEGTMEQRYRKATLNAGIGKARENIPPEIRRFLGQIDDPSFVFSSSMAEVERLWRQYRTTQALTTPDLQGKVWAPSFQEGMHPSPIPNQKRLYGEFAGKYVTPELYETVMQAPGATQPDLVQRFLIPLNSIFKTAKVGLNPVRYLSNWTSNALYSAAAGLPIWHWRWAPRMTQSARSMLAWGDSFLTPKAQGKTPNPGKDAAWMQWALEDGALPPGIGEEFGGSTAKAIARRFLQEKGSGPVEWMKHGWDSLRVARARLGEIYDAVDQHWRLAVYIEQVTKGTDNLKLPLPEARARAAQIVNENFASGGTVGPGVKKTAQNVGFVAPFMTYHADNLRVHYNWLKDSLNLGGLKGGLNSGQGSARALNVALQYALIGGLFEGMRRLSGFSDDDVRQAEAMLNTSYAKRNPVREWLPGRDAKGRAQVVSLGPALFPTDALIKGEGDSFLKRVLVNTVKGFADSGALEYPLQSVLEAAGAEEPEYRPPSVRPGMEGRALLEQAWNMVEPAAFQTARNIARRTGMAGTLRQNEEPLTPGQAAMQLTPFKVEPAGPRSSEGNRIRSQAQVGSAERSQNTGRLAVSAEEKKRLQDAAKAEQDRRRRLQEERIRALQKR